MPGYIGYTPQFQPISLQEYLTVPSTIIGEYVKAEDTYNETANKAEALKALLGTRTPENEEGWKIVDRYENMIGSLADDIASGIQGPDVYRKARNSQSYYRKNMLPLEAGITGYQTDEKEAKAFNKDGTLVRKKKYTLNDYIKNPNLKSEYILGSSIQAEAMKAAATASARKKKENDPTKALGNQKFKISSEVGFSPEEVQNWLKDPSSSQELTAIANQIADKYKGYDPKEINQYITRGILDGLAYDSKTSYIDNDAYKYAMEYNNWVRKQKYIADHTTQQTEETSTTRLPQRFNPIEGSNSKASEYNEFKALLDEIKANPAILNTQKPSKTIAQITQYANASDKNRQQENIKIKKQWDYYNKKQRFIELRDKIAKERGINSNMRIEPTGTGVTYNDVPNYKLIYDNRFDNLVSDIAEKSVGYTFDVTPAANEQIFQDMIKYSGANADGENSFILYEDGDKVDNSDIRKLDPNKTQYIIEDGIMWMISDGERYIVEPGAFGPMDAINRKQIKAIYDSGDIDTYNDLIQKHMDNISLKARTKTKGQSNTDSKISLDE